MDMMQPSLLEILRTLAFVHLRRDGHVRSTFSFLDQELSGAECVTPGARH